MSQAMAIAQAKADILPNDVQDTSKNHKKASNEKSEPLLQKTKDKLKRKITQQKRKFSLGSGNISPMTSIGLLLTE